MHVLLECPDALQRLGKMQRNPSHINNVMDRRERRRLLRHGALAKNVGWLGEKFACRRLFLKFFEDLR